MPGFDLSLMFLICFTFFQECMVLLKGKNIFNTIIRRAHSRHKTLNTYGKSQTRTHAAYMLPAVLKQRIITHREEDTN